MGIISLIRSFSPKELMVFVVCSLAVVIFLWIATEQLRSALLFMIKRDRILAFFHPYCDNGGGGERVLWVAIHALLEPIPGEIGSLAEKRHLQIAIYCGDVGRSKDVILLNVKKKFGISFTDEQAARIRIVHIRTRTLLEAKWYPVATMIGQSIGSMIVGIECILRLSPHVFIDSIGAPFTFLIVKLLTSAKIVAYVHYPIISEDMLNAVREQRPSYNNDARITSNISVSKVKLLYYTLFAKFYGLVGQCADSVMVNSSWTKKHIASLWNMNSAGPLYAKRGDKRRLSLVYPPCNTTEIQSIEHSMEAKMKKLRATHAEYDKVFHSEIIRQLDPSKVLFTNNDDVEEILSSLRKKKLIISIGQFRPEKDHMLQIKSMENLLKNNPGKFDDALLIMLGSTRNVEDENLVNHLMNYVDKQRLHKNVHIYTNVSYDLLLYVLRKSHIGIHTMWNEHFGISVVEMMAMGLVVIAHNSGGPKADIISNTCTGYLACTVDEYAETLAHILSNYHKMNDLKFDAAEAAKRFSDEVFATSIIEEFELISKIDYGRS